MQTKLLINRFLFFLLVIFFPIKVQANELHPRLFVTQKRIEQIQAAIQVPDSHHQQAFDALKTRVDQADWRIYDFPPDSGRWNYYRSYLAREAALLYLITNESKYAQLVYNTVYSIYNDPDPDNRLPDNNYGLSRAMIARNMAIAYDWAYNGLTIEQRNYLKSKINLALDEWENYRHANLENPQMASNWVAVCRGGELVMMLAVYEEENRSDRYIKLKEWLKTHIENAYGELGLSQEGIAYDGYAGTFLIPAIYALRSVGDTELDPYFNDKDFWKLIMYAGAFMIDKMGERSFLPSGVSSTGIIDEGWSSLLLASPPFHGASFYRYFYDYHMGINALGTPSEKFDERRGATIWSLIYYPENTPSFDPSRIFPRAISDRKRGAYFFRNRWQDENDIQVSIMADIDQHRNAWDQSEAFQISLLAYNTRYIIGPAKERSPDVFSALLVNGEAYTTSRTIGASDFFRSYEDGGYVIVDGGEKYNTLGVNNAKRHLFVKFNNVNNTALISTLDKIKDQETNTYTWQINLGDAKIDGQLNLSMEKQDNLQTFLLSGNNNSYLKGWIIYPQEAIVKLNDPLQVILSGEDANIWVVMVVGQGKPPTAITTGKDMATKLRIDNLLIYYDKESDRIKTFQFVDN